MSKAYLVLENGTVFEGDSFGGAPNACGELVFSTGVIGYLEALTDPCYYGQILMQTFPLIGNYGVIPADFESDRIWPSAYIVREWCQEPSNFRSEGDLGAFLRSKNIPALCGIDTRAVTRILREQGVMNARISETPELTDSQWAELRTYRVKGGVEAAGAKVWAEYGSEKGGLKLVLWDMGTRRSVIAKLNSLGCNVTVMPCSAKAEDIVALRPAGVIVSDGPGDPAENGEIISEVGKLFETGTPMLGIGLGHQLIALSRGGGTEKLHHGHRGASQPVLDRRTGTVFVTSQNHGYAVSSEKLPDGAVEQFVNCNDGSCEGLVYTDRPVFSVEFCPEVCAGSMHPDWLYERFLDAVRANTVKGGD